MQIQINTIRTCSILKRNPRFVIEYEGINELVNQGMDSESQLNVERN